MALFKKLIKRKILIFLVFCLGFLSQNLIPVWSLGTPDCPSESSCSSEKDVNKRESCLKDLVANCSKDINNLTGQINYINGQISLNELNITKTGNRIEELESEIASISGKIDRLETSLSTVINVLISRIIATYKIGNGEQLSMLLSSKSFGNFLVRAKYIRVVQEHDKKLLFQMQETKNNYVEQKEERERKRKEQADLKIRLSQEKVTLASNKKQKEVILESTKNNNVQYQKQLEEAKREQEQIQRAASLISTVGEKTNVRRGDPIGLMGNTGFSTGPHLHFSVYSLREGDLAKFDFDSSHENPFSYLSSQNVRFDSTSCDDVSSDQNKNMGSGGMFWPMSSATISQCYGHTPWSWRYRSGIHNGVDMYNNDDIVIRAAEDGVAYIYRGGQANGNGVFVFHNNGKMSLYWHLQ